MFCLVQQAGLRFFSSLLKKPVITYTDSQDRKHARSCSLNSKSLKLTSYLMILMIIF